jgi:hypothetical protein
MEIGGFFLLLVLTVVVVALVLWLTGLGGAIGLQRDKRGSDRAIGAAGAEGEERPLHKGGVPDQEEREKAEVVPPEDVPRSGE